MGATVVKAVRVRPQGEAAARRLVAAGAAAAAAAAPPARDPSAEFAEVVRARVDGPVLRYSQRLALLKEGERMGVGRFEANLVIARVMYQLGWGQTGYELRPERGRRWAGVVMTVVVVQAAILVGAWWVLG